MLPITKSTSSPSTASIAPTTTSDILLATAVTTVAYSSSIHIRRYFDESDKKFLTRYGIATKKQEFVDLASLSNIIVTEFERLETTKANNVYLVVH